MNIVIGRGKNRVVYELPCGDIINRANSHEPEAVKQLHANVCSLLGIEVRG